MTDEKILPKEGLISIEELAKRMGMNNYQLSKIFVSGTST